MATSPYETPAPVEKPQKGIQWKRWLLGTVIVLFLIVVFQNSQNVEFKMFWFINTRAPLILLLLLTALLGAAIGYITPILRDRKKTRSAAPKNLPPAGS